MSDPALVFLCAAQDACLGLAGIGCVYLLAAAAASRHFTRRSGALPKAAAIEASAVILKPLHGADPGLAARLAGFCVQNYPAPYRVVLGIQDEADGALQAARAVEARFPGRAVVTVDARQHGSNRKISNLINMDAGGREDVVVLCDSDIEVGPDYLQAVIEALQEPGVGAVTCLYHGVPARGLWSALSALAITAQFLPNAVTAKAFQLANPCCGSTIALRRETLQRIGGLPAFADCLADDHALGEAVCAHGLTIAIPPFSIGHVCLTESFAAYWAHEIRVARTIRSLDPHGHAGALVTHPFALGLLALLLGAGWAGLAAAAAALLCRLIVCRAVVHAFRLPRLPYGLIPLHEVLSFAVFAASFCGTRVHWSGVDYQVTAMGRLAVPRVRVGS